MNIDGEVVHERLRHLRDLLDDLALVGEVGEDRLREDRLLRHAVERILTQLVDLAVAINSHLAAVLTGQAPATYRESFAAAAKAGAISRELADMLAPSAGMRNILTHEYVDVNLGLLAGAVPMASRQFAEYVRQVSAFLIAE